MFAKRLFSSILLWAVLLTVLFYADYFGTVPSALLCCLIAGIAQSEFYDVLRKGGLRCFKRVGLLAGVLLSAGTWWFNVNHPAHVSTFETLFLAVFLVGLFIRQLNEKQDPHAIETVGMTLLGVMYIPWLFAFLPKIKYLYNGPMGPGPGWLFIFYVVAVTKFCDIGAYLTGRMFGRHKMIPRISPNKTWEGLVGGLVIALIASICAFRYLEDRIQVVGFDYRDAIYMGILLGGLGVLGDLCESLIKREMNVKDSGEVLPGIGGALDLIDSLLFTAPALYAYLVYLKISGG